MQMHVQADALHFLQDLLRTSLRALLGVFISAPLAALAAAGATEVVAGVVDHHFFGSMVAHAYALFFALITGYAVALTYGVVECIRGAIAISRWVGRKVEQEVGAIEKKVS